jgi:16S rRNA (guanine527-N7)-methyltransferase
VIDDRERVLSEYCVSRETADRLDLLIAELHRWQSIKNLVGAETLREVWTRHVDDSLQLAGLAPAGAVNWVDLGSGAGFPGMVVAIAAESPLIKIHLIESNARKCAFLRHVARITKAPVIIHQNRLEDIIFTRVGADVVTARALASLPQLFEWSFALLTTGTLGLFPKGRGVDAELTEAAKSWRFEAELIPSRTNPDGRIVRVTALERVNQ